MTAMAHSIAISTIERTSILLFEIEVEKLARAARTAAEPDRIAPTPKRPSAIAT